MAFEIVRRCIKRHAEPRRDIASALRPSQASKHGVCGAAFPCGFRVRVSFWAALKEAAHDEGVHSAGAKHIGSE
jgi:hypothetical protein